MTLLWPWNAVRQCIHSVFLSGLGNLAHRVAKSSISSHAFPWSCITIAHTASAFLTTSNLGGPVLNILTVNVVQHVCGVDYVDCLPANVFHEPRLAMIPTLELHFAFHRAFMNLYHEQKFDVKRRKETTKARFFNLVRRVSEWWSFISWQALGFFV